MTLTTYSSYTEAQKRATYKWRENNKAELKEYSREYYKANYSKNREKLLLNKQIWYSKRKDCDYNQECKKFRRIQLF